MVPRRFILITAGFLLSTFVVYQFLPWTPLSSINFDSPKALLSNTASSISNWKNPGTHSAQIQLFFDQVFSSSKPSEYNFPALKQSCSQSDWPSTPAEERYLKCGGMAAGLTSIVSQVKVCLKMAVDTGSNLVLPAMPLRDSTDLTDFNFFNADAYMTYDKWFDLEHMVNGMAKACPKMKIIHPDQLDTEIPVKHTWNVEIGDAPGYHFPDSYFWVGRPFKTFFDEQFAKRKAEWEASVSTEVQEEQKDGITVVTIGAAFLLFRITEDPTRQELALWNDLSLLIRFLDAPRQVIGRLLGHMERPFYGVHFRVEKDNIWSPLEVQLKAALESLDHAWAKFGVPDVQKPLVYLACGDAEQVKIFEKAGKERGWEVVHKWAVAEGNEETLGMIKDLAFDFQGAIDFGVMVKADFYIGITGSAFSSTVANARDTTGRYRGSSFDVYDDEGARNHLNNDGAASSYPCCL
ncbi:hypothetical protein N431DRAFT_485614 [Stipitochalara longipes BDJ]|nr:hypothetical protein N431DRAFT_485614 [Stipitochalara longipes BDJ]